MGGNLHLPKGTHHYEWTNEDTVIQLSGIGPVGMTYLDPADDPRKSTRPVMAALRSGGGSGW